MRRPGSTGSATEAQGMTAIIRAAAKNALVQAGFALRAFM
jgi:hypothetical protein